MSNFCLEGIQMIASRQPVVFFETGPPDANDPGGDDSRPPFINKAEGSGTAKQLIKLEKQPSESSRRRRHCRALGSWAVDLCNRRLPQHGSVAGLPDGLRARAGLVSEAVRQRPGEVSRILAGTAAAVGMLVAAVVLSLPSGAPEATVMSLPESGGKSADAIDYYETGTASQTTTTNADLPAPQSTYRDSEATMVAVTDRSATPSATEAQPALVSPAPAEMPDSTVSLPTADPTNVEQSTTSSNLVRPTQPASSTTPEAGPPPVTEEPSGQTTTSAPTTSVAPTTTPPEPPETKPLSTARETTKLATTTETTANPTTGEPTTTTSKPPIIDIPGLTLPPIVLPG